MDLFNQSPQFLQEGIDKQSFTSSCKFRLTSWVPYPMGRRTGKVPVEKPQLSLFADINWFSQWKQWVQMKMAFLTFVGAKKCSTHLEQPRNLKIHLGSSDGETSLAMTPHGSNRDERSSWLHGMWPSVLKNGNDCCRCVYRYISQTGDLGLRKGSRAAFFIKISRFWTS